jgi:arylsulfatase
MCANGGLISGSTLFIKDRKLGYLLHNGAQQIVLKASENVGPGKNTTRITFGEDKKGNALS